MLRSAYPEGYFRAIKSSRGMLRLRRLTPWPAAWRALVSRMSAAPSKGQWSTSCDPRNFALSGESRGWRGQAPRQPGQGRKAAATTRLAWVVVQPLTHLPAWIGIPPSKIMRRLDRWRTARFCCPADRAGSRRRNSPHRHRAIPVARFLHPIAQRGQEGGVEPLRQWNVIGSDADIIDHVGDPVG